MRFRELRSLLLIVTVLALMTVAITASAIMGSVVGIVLAVLLGAVALSYTVRHEMRSANLHHRRA